MRKKQLLYLYIISLFGFSVYAQKLNKADLQKLVSTVPDSAFIFTTHEKLLENQIYNDLAKEGWTSGEIQSIMRSYINKDKKRYKGTYPYGKYKKEWLPKYGMGVFNDTIRYLVDTTLRSQEVKNFREVYANDGNPENRKEDIEDYNPEKRKQGIRTKGVFHPAKPKPSSGRIHWIQVNQNDPTGNQLMVIPDGGGIFRTDNCGETWDCITDRIPDRFGRINSGYCIPVDPKNWNYVLSLASNGKVFKTLDGGQTWTQVENATSKSLKRGYAFRDANETLKIIGVVRGTYTGYNGRLFVTDDEGVTWHEFIPKDNQKDNGKVWFQEFAFDPNDRNIVYFTTQSGIFRSTDGMAYVNGKFNVERMVFKVYDDNNNLLLDNTTVFPLQANGPIMIEVDPNDGNRIWCAVGKSASETAIYYSEDKGFTWKTIHDTTRGIGSGNVFGNEYPKGWLGGFGVSFVKSPENPKWFYGCTMSSAISSDGGKNFNEFAWGTRLTSKQDDGNYYPVSNSRHNADNHCIVSHKSGRVFRGSDGGLLMIDENINNHQWTNIGGNMGQMLFASIKANKFGDQLLVGNNQDIDVQTYYKGRWGYQRGYETQTAFINPYGNTCYFSGGGGGGIKGLDYGSWNRGYSTPDVLTGNWYLRRESKNGKNFFRISDFGNSATNLYDNVGDNVKDFGITRDGDKATIFVLTYGNKIRKSTNNGETFTDVAQFPNSVIAVDPNHSDFIYIGQQGKVLKLNINSGSATQLSTTNLPDIDCHRLLFHEGSGDLYFVNFDIGIFCLENGKETWKLWTKGFYLNRFNDITINNTTQEMVISAWGRGVWIADLENPSDQFFTDGFQLKEISNVEGRKTIGIDTKWTIPLYYKYEWTVNGQNVNNPYQYLTRTLNVGDRVQLKLTLRESPDVSTTSSEYTVQSTTEETIEQLPKKCLYSNGKGRVDLGYVDLFHNNFTIDLWVNPKGDGVILANRQNKTNKEAKGWLLIVENGELKFKYSPDNIFRQPTYETQTEQEVSVSAGKIKLKTWSHIAVTQMRNGNIALYINGVKQGEETRILPESSLNNSMYLSLFADAWERSALDGSVDELRIWNYQLSDDEIKKVYLSKMSDNEEGLVYYNSFNNGTLSNEKELFSKQGMQSRVLAVTQYKPSAVIVGAEYLSSNTLLGKTDFVDGSTSLLSITPENSAFAPKLYVYGYDDNLLLEENTTLSTQYHNLESMSYVVKSFDNITNSKNEKVKIDFPLSSVDENGVYQLYTCEIASEKKKWTKVADLTKDVANNIVFATLPFKDIQSQRLVVVKAKPSILLSVDGLDENGNIVLYDESDVKQYVLKAEAVAGLEEPTVAYNIISNNEVVKINNPFYFVQNKAEGTLTPVLSEMGDFGTLKSVVLTSEDNKAQPFPLGVENRIPIKEIGKAIELNEGGVEINSGGIASTNTMTMMGWVKINSADMLSGTKPLLFFRSSSTATGIHLSNGQIRCHWDDKSWSWSHSTPLKLTSADVGRWVHVALVVRPNGIDYYLNGAKYTYNRSVNKTTIDCPFMLGKNHRGDKYFKGSFDQVALWNRSLSQDEIINYLQNRILINDDKLVLSTNMDYIKDNDVLDQKTEIKIVKKGTVNINTPSTALYNTLDSYKVTGSVSNDKPFEVAFPQNKAVNYFVNTFDEKPYNSAIPNSSDVAFNNKCYSLIYTTKTDFKANENVSLTFRDSHIKVNDELTLWVRPLGSQKTFVNSATATASQNGSVQFTFAGNKVNEASELMVMLATPHNLTAEITPVTEVVQQPNAPNNVILADDVSDIKVNVHITDGVANHSVTANVTETAYASLMNNEIDTDSDLGTELTIHIDKNAINKTSYNPVTINLTGADAEPLVLNVSLEPKVELTLENGTDANHFTATETIENLNIKTKLLQGVLTAPIEFNTVSEVDGVLNTSLGTQFADVATKISDLEYVKTSTDASAGWNLIGNPVFSNIKMTKQGSVEYNMAKITKFIYQYNYSSENYEVADMTKYDAMQHLIPFQAYFVKTMEEDANLVINPSAKQPKQQRIGTSETANEIARLSLQLFTNDVISDHTDVVLGGVTNDFDQKEDAPKLWTMGNTANSLYTMAGTEAVAVNTLTNSVTEIPLKLKVKTAGAMSLEATKFNGFTKKSGRRIELYENGVKVWTPSLGGKYSFNVATVGDINDRFVLKIKGNSTDNGNVFNHKYSIQTKNKTCIISNLRKDNQIIIYDVSGKVYVKENATSSRFVSRKLPVGVYQVLIVEDGREFFAKVLVK